MQVDAAGGQAKFAALAGVSPQYVCDCLSGRRDIGKSIARVLGYELVTMYQPTEVADPECICDVNPCKYPLCSGKYRQPKQR
jgi:DNA-binding transcriptional regulator YdaS (Cro superfamily)